MLLSKNNIFVKLYKKATGKLPNDFCSLFWKCILYLVWLPFIIGITIWNTFRSGWVYIVLLIAVLVVILAIIALLVGISYWREKRRYRLGLPEPAKKEDSRLVRNAKDWWGALREKHCTKIYYKES